MSRPAGLSSAVPGDGTDEPLVISSLNRDEYPAPRRETSGKGRLLGLGTALVVLALVATACSRQIPTVTEIPLPSTTTTPVAAEGPGGPAVDEVAARLDKAVTELIEADSYRFDVTVSIATRDSVAEVALEGWVDGADRELVMRTGSEQVTTRVIDGLATVERQGETVEVPLESATTAPSLNVLTAITNISWAPGNTIRGALSASALEELGFDVTGAATVTATLRRGSLARYILAAADDSWTIRTNFTNIVA